MENETGDLKNKRPLVFNSANYHGQAMICFTYDDGLLDNYELAMPAHLKYDITATFAIIANRVIDSSFYNKFINIEQMQEMSRMGFEISSHGFYHTKKFPELDSIGLDRELNIAKKSFKSIATW